MTGETAGAAPARFEPKIVALMWALGAAFSWACASVAVRYIGGRLPATDLSFYRSVAGVLLMLPVIWPHRTAIATAGFKRSTVALFGLRGALIFGGQAGFYFALVHIPLAEANVLNSTIPVFVAVLAVLFLRERVGLRRWLIIGAGFLGVVVILRPGIQVMHVAAPLAVLSAFLFAAANIVNKVLTRTEPASRIVFFTNLLVSFCGVIPFVFLATEPRWDEVPLIAVICVAGTAAQFFIARAIAIADASFVSPTDFMRVPLTALAGWILFSEFPDVWMWIGSAVVFVSIVFLTRSHRSNTAAGTAP